MFVLLILYRAFLSILELGFIYAYLLQTLSVFSTFYGPCA